MFHAKIQGAGDVEDVEGTASNRRGVFAAEVTGPLESGPPQDIGLNVAALGKVFFQRGQSVIHGNNGDVFSEGCQADAIDHLDASMMRHRQRASHARTPRAHPGRLGLMNVKLQQCAWIGVGRFSGRHDYRRAEISPLSG